MRPRSQSGLPDDSTSNGAAPPTHPTAVFTSRLAPWLQTGRWVGVTAAILLPLGVGVVGLTMLLNLPEFSGCGTVGRSHSASLRLYCAQELANQRTVDSLLDAVQLLEHLPAGDPLEATRDRLVERWSADLLALAEETFQNGDLQAAIDITEKIPELPTIRDQVRERAARWRASWSAAEEIYEDTEAAIAQENWQEAYGIAKKLLGVGNRHWETARYEELTQSIQAAKNNKDEQVKSAKRTKPKPADDPLNRWQKEQDAEDLAHLTKAQALARAGDLESLRKAIDEAEQVFYGTPRYKEAQKLITSWSQRIETTEDRVYLDRAIALADKGDAVSLQAAIDEANQIFIDRPLYQEARRRVSQWTLEMQQIQAQADLTPALPPATGSTAIPVNSSTSNQSDPPMAAPASLP